MDEPQKEPCPLCKEPISIHFNEKGEGTYDEHVANDAPVLCKYSGMVAIPTSETRFGDMII